MEPFDEEWKEWMFSMLFTAFQVAATEADTQVGLYPPFCCPVHSVREDVEEAIPPVMGKYASELPEAQRRSIEELSDAVSRLREADFDCGGSVEREKELLSNSRWNEVRARARQALAVFGIERKDPSPATENGRGGWWGPG